MKRQLLATVSCLALAGVISIGAAVAADLPVKAPRAPVLAQTWAGPYIGLNGGAVWHQLDTDTTLFGFGAYDTARLRATGATFGGQIGHNWQSQNFVYGLEADLNWVGADDSNQHVANNGLGFPVIHTTKLSWLATVRGRAGVAFGPTLIYGTGGLAVGGVKNHWTFAPGICCDAVTENSTRVGWTAGGGIEHALSGRVTIKAEALYVDLGSDTKTSQAGFYSSRFRNTAVVGRVGVNLRW
jgi:outer membrane immunogenic protein